MPANLDSLPLLQCQVSFAGFYCEGIAISLSDNMISLVLDSATSMSIVLIIFYCTVPGKYLRGPEPQKEVPCPNTQRKHYAFVNKVISEQNLWIVRKGQRCVLARCVPLGSAAALGHWSC